MTPLMALFVYVNLWCVGLFFAFPFSMEAKDVANLPENDAYAAAPRKIYWKKLLILASVISAFMTASVAVVIYLYKQGYIPYEI